MRKGVKIMVTNRKLFFLSPDGKFQLWSHAIKFWQDFFQISDFGHFFCPFSTFPKNFAQNFSIVSTKVFEFICYKRT